MFLVLNCSPNGYRVIRVPVFRSADSRALNRLFNYLTFMLTAVWVGMRLSRPDAIIAVSPLPAGLAALLVHWRHRSPLVFDLQDIWPDSARAVGVMNDGLAISLLQKAERLLYRCSSQVVVISEGFRRYLKEIGVPPGRIAVIHNGVETATILPGATRGPDQAGRPAARSVRRGVYR